MWLDNLKELKKEKNVSTRQLAEKANLPEKTVTRILSGHTANPYIDTLDRLATALECSIGDILAGTKAVVGDNNLSTLQESLDTITAERDLLVTDNRMLNEKVAVQAKEIELLTLKLMYTEKLLATHDYYNKIKNN